MPQSNHPTLASDKEHLLKSTSSSLSIINLIMDEGNPVYWYRQGCKHKESNNYEAALYCFTRSTDLAPSHSKYHGLKAYAAYRLYKLELTAEALKQGFINALRWDHLKSSLEKSEWQEIVTFLEKKSIPSYSNSFSFTLALLATGDVYKSFIELCGIILSYDLDDPYLYNLDGLIKYESQDYKNAIVEFHKSIEIRPHNPLAYFHIAFAYRELKNYPKSIENCSIAFELAPNFFDALVLRGFGKAMLGDIDSAIDEYTQVISLDPGNAWAFNNRGFKKAYFTKDFEGAIHDFTNAIELEPKRGSAYYGRGFAKSKLKNYKEAIDDFSKAIELKHDKSGSYFERGTAHRDLKNYDAAVDDYSRSIEIEPTSHKYHNRGLTKFFMEQYPGAIEDLSLAIELDQNNTGPLYYLRGFSYQKLNKLNEANLDLTRAVEIDPTPEYLYRLGTIKSDLDEYEIAIFLYSKALDLKIDHQYLMMRGVSKSNLMDFEGALEDYFRCIELDPDTYIYYYLAGNIFKYLRKYEEAINQYSIAIKLNPKHKDSYIKRSKAYEATGEVEKAKLDLEIAVNL